MRFHVVALPHTQTTEAFSSCAFNEKVRKFCKMMHEIKGHDVFLYAGEQNEAPCTEHIQCISEEERVACLNGKHYTQASFDYTLPHWRKFNGRAAEAILDRAQKEDFLCVIGGLAHKQIADAHPVLTCVEFGIGYPGTFAKFRVWESYAWMHLCYGAGKSPQAVDGVWFDEVIPSYFELEKFPYRGDYERDNEFYLFMGRLVHRKGFLIACEVCKALGKRLVLAGPLSDTPTYGEYIGEVGAKKRGQLMSEAVALFAPTIYIEPFGSVAAEAQLCGTPVISTDWGAYTETVVEGVTGFRCRTFQEFCDATEKVKHLDRRTIHRRAKKLYGLEPVADRYEAYFKKLLTLWDKGWYQRS